MRLKFLLDTNVVSEPLRPKPAPGVLRRLRKHQDEIAVPSPVWHELRFGCAQLGRSKKRTAIERYLADVVAASFPILPYDRAAAEWHALERSRLARGGQVIPFVDGQIAAIARTNDLVLVTGNRKDFRLFEGLELADWTS